MKKIGSNSSVNQKYPSMNDEVHKRHILLAICVSTAITLTTLELHTMLYLYIYVALHTECKEDVYKH